MYEVRLARSARKELEALPDDVLTRVSRRIDQLANVPRPRGCKKLRGTNDLWRVRVGNYRVIYVVDDSQRLVDIRAIGHRGDVYG